MRRASSVSSTGSLSTPVAANNWGSQRPVPPENTLYPRALAVLAKMRKIPGMAAFEEIASRPAEELPPLFRPTLDVVPQGKELDAVSLLLRMFRLGGPLTLVYNALHKNQPLNMINLEDALDIREVKRSIYHFISASAHELEVKMTGDHFMVTQVFGSAASDVLRPLQIVEILLSRLDPATPANGVDNGSSAGSLASPSSTSSRNGSATSSAHRNSNAPLNFVADSVAAPTSLPTPTSPMSQQTLRGDDLPLPQDQRSKVVDELLQTERKYVQDLEVLLQFHDEMINLGISREIAATITPGLGKLVEFQRRFSVGLEYQIRQADPKVQNIGWLFLYLLPGFEVYKKYTLGQKEAMQTAISETSALMPLSHILEPMYELPSTLLKPVQRILRYPLLLKEILKKTPSDWPHYAELQSALDAMQELTADVNETQRKAENQSVTLELQDRVRDWKNLDTGALGELLLSGVFPVANQNEVEQEYHVYAFERCVVFFRDRVAFKKTPLTKMRSTTTSRNSQVKSVSLELRGRVYIKYISNLTRTKLPSAGYSLRIVWGHHNDASEHGYLDVRLVNEEMSLLWEQTILKQRSRLHEEAAAELSGVPAGRLSDAGGEDTPIANDSSLSPNAHGTNSVRSSRSASVVSLPYNARSSQTSLSQLHRWPTAGNTNDAPDRKSLGAHRSSGSSAHLAGGRRNSSMSNSGTSNSSYTSNTSSSTHYGYPGSVPFPINTSAYSNTGHAANPYSSPVTNNVRSFSSNANDISLPEDVMPVQFWGNDLGGGSSSTSPMDALRKLSVGSVNSQHSFAMGSTSSITSANASRSSLSLNHQQQSQSQQSSLQSQQRHLRSKPSDSSSSLNLPGQRKVRIHTEGDTFLLLVTPDMSFDSLIARVQRKLKLCGKLEHVDPAVGLKFQYVDEDEDYVRLESDDDLLVAFDSVPEQNELSIYVNI